MARKGQCFVYAFKKFDFSNENELLVHGYIKHSILDGFAIAHAWLENGEYIRDMLGTTERKTDKSTFYNNFVVPNAPIIKYNKFMVIQESKEHNTYGPWSSHFRHDILPIKLFDDPSIIIY